MVEKGWNCTGGSKLMPDTCTYVQSPTPTISLINNQNQVFISFDEEVILIEDLVTGAPKFTIAVTGDQPTYKFEWTLDIPVNVGDHI